MEPITGIIGAAVVVIILVLLLGKKSSSPAERSNQSQTGASATGAASAAAAMSARPKKRKQRNKKGWMAPDGHYFDDDDQLYSDSGELILDMMIVASLCGQTILDPSYETCDQGGAPESVPEIHHTEHVSAHASAEVTSRSDFSSIQTETSTSGGDCCSDDGGGDSGGGDCGGGDD